MSHKDEPAFPVTIGQGDFREGYQNGPSTWQCPGMTLRDWFAGQALTSLSGSDARNSAIAKVAYDIADAMLEKRKHDAERTATADKEA